MYFLILRLQAPVRNPCSSLVLGEQRSPSGSVSPWLSPAALCGLAEGKAALVMFKICIGIAPSSAACPADSLSALGGCRSPGPARSLLAGRRWLLPDRSDPLRSAQGTRGLHRSPLPSFHRDRFLLCGRRQRCRGRRSSPASVPGSDGGARTAAAAAG